MDETGTIVAASASQPRLDNVSFDSGESAGAEFARVVDAYRGRADKLDETVGKLIGKDGQGPAADPQIQQLANLYSYAVDTQLVVRTSSQLSTGVRQLMSGQ
jgi:hypothetical protein